MTSFPNQFQENSSLIRSALERGIINTRICFESVPGRMMLTESKSVVPRAHIQNIDQNSQALRTQIHTFDRTGVLDTARDHLIELARITVPQGNVGHVQNIEQYLADVEGSFYASSSQYWGMPYNETVPINDIIWLFRIDNFYGRWVPQFYANGLPLVNFRALLPGNAWWDLPEFNGIWYPANHNKNFVGTIPTGKQLRFFAFVPATAQTQYIWNLSGRLTARIQSELCPEAQINTRILS